MLHLKIEAELSDWYKFELDELQSEMGSTDSSVRRDFLSSQTTFLRVSKLVHGTDHAAKFRR